jgi:hypothetical protein
MHNACAEVNTVADISEDQFIFVKAPQQMFPICESDL